MKPHIESNGMIRRSNRWKELDQLQKQGRALRFVREACLTRSLTDKQAHQFNKLGGKNFLGEGAPENLAEYREAIVSRLRMSTKFQPQR